MEEIGSWKYFAVADCTGHGVPGALMSMICMEKLRDYIQLEMPPNEVLQKSNLKIRKALGQNFEDRTTYDGMDVALIRYQKQNNHWILEYAGAGRPFWIQKANQPGIEELKGTKAGIGGSTSDLQEFKLNTISLQPADSLYFFTDGYTDQFSEASRRKITTRRLKELLETYHSLPMSEKGKQLDQFLQKWQGDYMQIDDILVVGLKLS
ncbi:MAG: serine/threonine-protein phosphatase [Sphingobacteriia bacterium]|nr:serine/threonine-protein phosphatase [Sphingobacteriia bacterium]